MTRILAALTVVALGLTLAVAQERPPLGGRLNPMPIEVLEKDGRVSWKVAGRGDVRVEDLMMQFASATGTLVSYADNSVGRHSATYTAPDKGYVLAPEQIPLFVSDLLQSAAGYTLVGFTEGRTRVVKLEDAPALARHTDLSALKTINEAEWVNVRVPLERLDTRAAMAAMEVAGGGDRKVLRSHMSGSVLMLSGRADRVRRLVQAAQDLDSIGAAAMHLDSVRAFEVPAGLKAAEIVAAIQAHFPVQTTTVVRETGASVTGGNVPRVTATASAGGNRVVAKGTVADLNIVEQLIEAMK